jgi:hypothetical protein
MSADPICHFRSSAEVKRSGRMCVHRQKSKKTLKVFDNLAQIGYYPSDQIHTGSLRHFFKFNPR